MDFSRLDNFIFRKMSDTRLPSVTAVLVKGSEPVWTAALGFRDLERALPATPETLYGIGSVTKSFTALSILQLAEAGKLSLDDPVEKYVPLPVRPFGEQILIRHFLSHTSGIPGLGMSESASRNRTRTGDHWLPVSSYADLLTFLQDAGDWVVTRPGERWFYLNEGYVLLGQIIEICSGLPYYDYVRANILEPLGMLRTCFTAAELEKEHDAAVPYVVANDGSRIPSTYPWGAINAKGGLISSVVDMAKYLGMYLNHGAGPHGTLLSRAGLQEMTAPRIATPPKEGFFGEMQYAYGLGVNANFLGRRLVGHGGSVRVSTAYMGFLPDEGWGAVVLANGAGYTPQFIAMAMLAAALGEDPQDLPFVRREQLLKELAGSYCTYQGTTRATVRKAGDLLMLVMEDRLNPLTLPLYPHQTDGDPLTFYTITGGAKVYVEFYRKPGQTTMIYERYAYRKTG